MEKLIAVAVVDLKPGAALDWAVAKAVGREVQIALNPFDYDAYPVLEKTNVNYRPSQDWSHGGNIIDTLELCSWRMIGEKAEFSFSQAGISGHGEGSTMLEAAMKAIVKAKFGDAVSVPRELAEVAK